MTEDNMNIIEARTHPVGTKFKNSLLGGTVTFDLVGQCLIDGEPMRFPPQFGYSKT